MSLSVKTLLLQSLKLRHWWLFNNKYKPLWRVSKEKYCDIYYVSGSLPERLWYYINGHTAQPWNKELFTSFLANIEVINREQSHPTMPNFFFWCNKGIFNMF